MPISWNIGPMVGDTLRVRKINTETGVIAILFRNLPPKAKDALEYLADTATRLEREKEAYRVAYDGAVRVHTEMQRETAAKTSLVLQKGIELLEHNEQLAAEIAELRKLYKGVLSGG